MRDLTLQELDALRGEGLRPNVVLCIVHNKRILFLYTEEYKLWGFSQAGVKNGETAQEALWREMAEEIGADFVKNCKEKLEFIGYDQIDFPKKRHGSKPLQTDDGKPVTMRGKFYQFYYVQCDETKMDVLASEFDAARWVAYDDTQVLVDTIYQKGKKRVIEKALSLLKEKGVL